jgi:integrase
MTSVKYIGLDVHQATIAVAVRDAGGKLVMESLIETRASTILEFIAGLRGKLVIIKLDHKFELDTSRPRWHGWHAFRRGLATNLHRLGVPDKVIQQILRHSNVAVTQECYIKTVTADSAAAMRQFEERLSEVLQ